MKNSAPIDLDQTVSSQQMEHRLDDCNPLECVLFSHSPSVQVYYSLRSRLESSSNVWLQEFVSLDGLDSLLDSLGHMTGPKFSGFSDAILQIDCLSCVRAVLNSRVGMESLVSSHDGVYKLLKGIQLANTLPRKHVLELLSAVCVHSKQGYCRLLEALDKSKRENQMYHRFSFIVNELKMAETVPHKTAVMTFINSIICSTVDRMQRCRIRNDFIGLTLLDIISFLQREDSDEDLYIQLQIFLEKKHEDELMLDLESSLDLNSPQDLADAIQTKVFGGSKMVCFVNILQDLLAIETLDKEKSDVLWQVLERHVHHMVHGLEDARTLNSLDTESACQAITESVSSEFAVAGMCHQDLQGKLPVPSEQNTEKSRGVRKLSRNSSTSSMKREGGGCLKISADSGFVGCEDKLSPPPLPMTTENISNSHNSSPPGDKLSRGYLHQACMKNNMPEIITCEMKVSHADTYSTTKNGVHNTEQAVADRKTKHLSVYDNLSPAKLPLKRNVSEADAKFGYNLNNLNSHNGHFRSTPAPNKPPSKTNLHLNVEGISTKDQPSPGQSGTECTEKRSREQHNHNYLSYQKNRLAFPANEMRSLRWVKLDEQIVEEFSHSIWANTETYNLRVQPDFQQVEELFRESRGCDENPETQLLNGKTRLSLNLFLNRLDEEPTVLVKRLVRVDEASLPLPFIKHLVDVLPEPEEVKQLKFFNGNLLNLGQAEQFVLHLSDLPDYEILLTGQLRRAEFAVTTAHLHSVLASMLETSHVILSNTGLREVFLLVLKLGNFLNHGQYNGYAGGFKLSSLTRLPEVKSREPGQNIVHFLVSLIESTDDRLLSFLSEIPRLQKAASCCPADIKAEFDKMNAQINTFVRQLASANPIIKEGFDKFLEEVKTEFRELQNQISELKVQSQRLAAFFCESDAFELQACFKALLGFFKTLRACRQETKLLQRQKMVAAKHSDMFTQQIHSKKMALRFGQEAGASSSMVEERKAVVDILLAELHRGNFHPSADTSPLTTQPDAKTDMLAPELPVKATLQRPVTMVPEVKTPDRERGSMELSHISLMGTPMMNRPSSDLYDEELTMIALHNGQRIVTSSENNLLKGDGVGTHRTKIPPVMAIPQPLARTASQQSKTHHRSRSDLASSINVTAKWIRYQDQLRLEQLQAPLARPESSITLATLNLEPGGVGRFSQSKHAAMALVNGPTVELPPRNTTPEEFVRHGKKNERKSTLSNFINRISRRVLKQRNSDQNIMRGENEGSGDEAISDCKSEKASGKIEKSSKWGSLGKASGMAVKQEADDKENICDGGPFDRHKKNPIRLSNRFKGKILKS